MALNTFKGNGYEHLCEKWLWKPVREMTLNAYGEMALNTYVDESGGSKHLWEKWIWMPMKVIALNAYLKVVALNVCGSKHLWKWKCLWMPMKMIALNGYESDSFERLWKWRL